MWVGEKQDTHNNILLGGITSCAVHVIPGGLMMLTSSLHKIFQTINHSSPVVVRPPPAAHHHFFPFDSLLL